MITLNGLRTWLKKKVNAHGLPTNWEKEVDEYFKEKKAAFKKFQVENKWDKDVLELENQLKEATALKYFLDKEDLGQYKLPKEIHPAGEIRRGLVIEPISPSEFAYNWMGVKGISKVMIHESSKRHYIFIGDEEILLKDRPIKEFAFTLPNSEILSAWVKNGYYVPTTEQLKKKIEHLFRVLMDLQQECFYNVIPLFVFQTWLQGLFDVVFYISIGGQWGGGKTTLGELIVNLCHHGFSADPSVAVVARGIDRQKLSIFIDELDSITSEDGELLSIIRKGYRRGEKFARTSKDSLEPQFFDVFGSKLWTIHTTVEDALQTRSIPIHVTESPEGGLAEINMIKKKFLTPLFNDLFLWYLDNGIYFCDRIESVDFSKLYDSFISDYSKDSRGGILKEVSHIVKQYPALNNLKGRNRELAAVMVNLLKILDLEVNEKELADIFEVKREIEEERMEGGFPSILRDILVKFYEERKHKRDYITEDGCLKVSHKELYNAYNDELRKNTKGSGVSPKYFQGLTREFGFERPTSKKKMKIVVPEKKEHVSMLCYIYTKRVLQKIGLPEHSLLVHTDLEDFENE